MPPRGWTTITVPQSLYDYFYEKYLKNKDEYRRKYGITSFSGFVSKSLSELMDQYESKIRSGKK